jgi:hypothetical protein
MFQGNNVFLKFLYFFNLVVCGTGFADMDLYLQCHTSVWIWVVAEISKQ